MTQQPDGTKATGTTGTRRPIGARSAGWAVEAAAFLAVRGVSPNAISAASVGFGLLAGLCLSAAGGAEGWWARALLLVLAGAFVGARLLANMLDGMVATEHRRAAPDGALWNEVPDRLADVAILVGAGAGVAAADAGPDWLGWLAAVTAVLTAYVREIGARLGAAMDFSGPMAKPHRMAVIIGCCAAGLVEGLWGGRLDLMAIGLWAIVLGAGWTAAQRLMRVRDFLMAAKPAPDPGPTDPPGA